MRYMDTELEGKNIYIMQKDLQWGKIETAVPYDPSASGSKGVCVLPMRAYIKVGSAMPSRRFLETSFTSGIGDAARLKDNGQMIKEVYDLQGRKVNGKPRKGMYINGGNKIVIK